MDYIISFFSSFLSIIKTFQFKDFVDILCITFVIYLSLIHISEPTRH